MWASHWSDFKTSYDGRDPPALDHEYPQRVFVCNLRVLNTCHYNELQGSIIQALPPRAQVLMGFGTGYSVHSGNPKSRRVVIHHQANAVSLNRLRSRNQPHCSTTEDNSSADLVAGISQIRVQAFELSQHPRYMTRHSRTHGEK